MSISERARAKAPMCEHCPARTDRSLPQHRRLFGLVRAAFTHWPESHEFQPENEEHLRKWLLCKAGHHTVKTLTLADLTSTEAVVLLQSAFHAAGAYSFVKATAGRVHIFTPESIAFDKLDHKAACKLFDEIGAVVEVEMGIRADDLLKQTEEAA